MTKPPSAADLVIRDLADGEAYWRERAIESEADLTGYRLVALVAIAQLCDQTAKLEYEGARSQRLGSLRGILADLQTELPHLDVFADVSRSRQAMERLQEIVTSLDHVLRGVRS